MPTPWERRQAQQPPADPTFDYKRPQIAGQVANTGANTVRTRVQTQGDVVDNQTKKALQPYVVTKAKNEAAITDFDVKERQRKAFEARMRAAQAIRGVLDKADKADSMARGSGGWFTTGGSGAFVRGLPKLLSAGTKAYDLANTIKPIDANMAIQNITEMRQNSPTGAAVGNVSDKDMELMRSTVASTDPDASNAEFIRNLNDVRTTYVRMLGQLDPKAKDEYMKAFHERYPNVGGSKVIHYDSQGRRIP